MKNSQQGIAMPVVLIVIGLVVVGGAGAYWYNKTTTYRSEPEIPTSTETESINNPSPIVSPNANQNTNNNFKVYINDDLGFEVAYPGTWEVIRVNRQTGANDSTGTVVSISPCPRCVTGSKLGIEYNAPDPISVYTNDSDITLVSQSPTTIGGIAATTYVFKGPFGSWTTYYTNFNGSNYAITVSGESEIITKQILPTLKFTK